MTTVTLAIIAFAAGLDLLIGEPRTAFHPVAWFGRLVGLVDREWDLSERAQRLMGLLVAITFPLGAAGLVAVAVVVAGRIHYAAPALTAGVVLFLTTSLRSLLELTADVVETSERDPAAARESVRGLVGRDASELSPAELRSAAVESAAENLADGYVATLVPFVLLAPLSLPAAAGVATWIKAVNTLDSMVGYPEKPIGTASARLDDAVMWLPARLTALLLAVAAGRPGALGRARGWARAPPSPNSGWPMAVTAAVLDVRLAKPGVYDLNPGARLPTVDDGETAVTLVGLGAVLAVLVAAVGAIAVSLFVEPAMAAGTRDLVVAAVTANSMIDIDVGSSMFATAAVALAITAPERTGSRNRDARGSRTEGIRG